MASRTQQAGIISEKNGKIQLTNVPIPVLSEEEVLIKNHTIGTNPVDWKIQRMGILVTSFPAILGFDVAGTIEEVGSRVTKFKKGDRVFAFTPLGKNGFNPRFGAFQEFTVSTEAGTGLMPHNASFEEAAALCTGVATASCALYLELGIPRPVSAKSRPPLSSSSSILYVNGGTSTVGSAAIQFGALSGLRVIATSSPKNFDLVKSFGASDVFDYKDPELVQKVRAAAGKDIEYSFDAAGSGDEINKSAQVLGEHGVLATSLFPPKDLKVKVVHVQASGFHNYPDLASWTLLFVKEAFESHTFVGLKSEVVGHGLADLQKVLDYHASGQVSATKPVIKLI